MKTFLFAGNPTNWPWEYLNKSIDQIRKTGITSEPWTIASYKKVQPGDRAFLMRLGKDLKGLMASDMLQVLLTQLIIEVIRIKWSTK